MSVKSVSVSNCENSASEAVGVISSLHSQFMAIIRTSISIDILRFYFPSMESVGGGVEQIEDRLNLPTLHYCSQKSHLVELREVRG